MVEKQPTSASGRGPSKRKHGERFPKALTLDPLLHYLPDKDRHLDNPGEVPYKFNLIGAGRMGQEHIRATHLEGRATIHGLYDPNPRSVEAASLIHSQHSRKKTPLLVYDSLKKACNDPEIDGLIISTPNHTHLEVMKVATLSEKPILLEKPIAATLSDSYEVFKLAEAYPAPLQIGLQYRYNPMYSEAIYETLDRRSIGDVKLVGIQEHRFPFLDKVSQWNKFAEYSGDTLVEKCCHHFDLLNLFAQGRPEAVYATGNTAVNFKDFEYESKKSDILDNAMVIVDYENNVRASFSLCMFAPMSYNELMVAGDEGWLKGWEREDFLTKDVESQLEIFCGDRKPSRKTTPRYPAVIEQSGHRGATYFEHAHFVDSIESGQTTATTAKEGLWSIIVASAAQESIKKRQVVAVSELLDREGVKV